MKTTNVCCCGLLDRLTLSKYIKNWSCCRPLGKLTFSKLRLKQDIMRAAATRSAMLTLSKLRSKRYQMYELLQAARQAHIVQTTNYNHARLAGDGRQRAIRA